MSSNPAEWRTCSYCGETAPPDGSPCPTCGYDVSLARGEAKTLPKRTGQRFRFVQSMRILIVVVAAVGLSYALISAVWSGPQTFPDPLTTSGTVAIGAGNFTSYGGNITGEDYIEGNYTVLLPFATQVTFNVYNQTEFGQLLNQTPTQSLDSVANLTAGRIVFAAPYTDMFYLVFQNPYPAFSDITIHVYVTMTYESNVVLG